MYLNDGAEFNYATELFATEIQMAMEREPNAQQFLTALSGSVRFAQDNIVKYPFTSIYVASFSGAGDLLSQWRAYCPDQRGVSIGFSMRRLARAAVGFELVKCIYSEGRQRSALRALLDSFVNSVPSRAASKDVAAAVHNCVRQLKALAPAFKHPSFSEEREWRLVGSPHTADTEVNFRSGRSMLVPYLQMPLPSKGDGLEIDRVIVGPTPHAELSARSVENLLLMAGGRHVKITNATVPYRPW
jgi:hypothetical protein